MMLAPMAIRDAAEVPAPIPSRVATPARSRRVPVPSAFFLRRPLLISAVVLLAVVEALLWWPQSHLSLKALSGTWRVDTASMPSERRGLTPADAEELAAWKDAVLVIAPDHIVLRTGGQTRELACSEGQASEDIVEVLGPDGLLWTIYLQDGLITLFTGTRAGSIPFQRSGD